MRQENVIGGVKKSDGLVSIMAAKGQICGDNTPADLDSFQLNTLFSIC